MDTPQPQTPVPMRLEHQISWKGRYAETKAVEVKKHKNTFVIWIVNNSVKQQV